MTKVKEVQVQLGRPVDMNSARQKRLADLEARRANGTLKRGRPVDPKSANAKKKAAIEARKAAGEVIKRGRPVDPNSASAIKKAALEARRASGEVIKRGRPAGTGKVVTKEQAKKVASKRFKVVMNNDGEETNYSKSFTTPKSAIKEMKELGFTDYKLVEFNA
jgi:hypothetical protein